MLEKALLWELKKQNAPVSYLFGTMHIKNEVSYKHLDSAIKVLQQSEAFYAEINLDEAASSMDPNSFLLPDEGVLTDYISEKKYYKIKQILRQGFNFDLEKYRRFLPLIITNRLTEAILNNKAGKSLDAHLWSEAKKLKLDCNGLESLEEQLVILKTLDLDYQFKMLKDLARDISKFRRLTKKLEQYYLDQDIKKLHQTTKKQLGKIRKLLLHDRNVKMAFRINSSMSVKSFYAIGAGHLAGNKGVLALLKRQGITLAAIK